MRINSNYRKLNTLSYLILIFVFVRSRPKIYWKLHVKLFYRIGVWSKNFVIVTKYWRSLLEVFLGEGVLKICSKFSEEHQCRSAIFSKSNFFAIALRQGCSPVNLLHTFRTPFSEITSGGLLLYMSYFSTFCYLEDFSFQMKLEDNTLERNKSGDFSLWDKRKLY